MNPLLIMALLTAASAGANYQSQKKVDHVRANALNEELRRRKEAGKRSAASAQSTAELLTNVGKDQDAKAAEIEAQYNADAPKANAPTSSPLLSGFSAPAHSTLTVGADTRALDRSRADTGALAKAKAKLNAFGDVMVDRNIQAGRNQVDIDRENTGVRNWNQFVLPAKMARAQAAGQDWSTLADALQLASAIYSPIGLSKVGAAKGLKTAYDVSTTAGAGGAGAFAGLV